MGTGADGDIVRQWAVSKYVMAGVAPYALAKDILIETYGSPEHDRDGARYIGYIPQEVPTRLRSSIIAQYGSPEASYPPPAIGLLALSLGWLQNPDPMLLAWFVVNLVALGAVVAGLASLWPIAPRIGFAIDGRILILAFLLLFPPVFYTVERGQFSLVVFACLLAASNFSSPAPHRIIGRTTLNTILSS